MYRGTIMQGDTHNLIMIIIMIIVPAYDFGAFS